MTEAVTATVALAPAPLQSRRSPRPSDPRPADHPALLTTQEEHMCELPPGELSARLLQASTQIATVTAPVSADTALFL